jgi:hypothetical protein
MVDIFCRVTDVGLVPMYDSDSDEKHRLRVGDTVLCRITRPRNYEFHKKFFALVRLTYLNLPEHLHEELNVWSEEDMLACMKLDLGYATTIFYEGREIVKLGSISFAKMDDTEFQRFYDRCLFLVQYKYLRGIERDTLLEEIGNFL